MQGLITELPQPYHRQVTQIWEELQQSFHLGSAREITPIPHFTWHVADSYTPQVIDILREFLKDTTVPMVTTTGIGIFHNTAPVVYLSIHATIPLLQFHHEMMSVVLPETTGSIRWYEPELWTPHITLALGDTDPHSAGEIVSRYSAVQFDWQFTPTNIMWITETPQGTYAEKEIIHIG